MLVDKDKGNGLWDWQLVKSIIGLSILFFVYKIAQYGYTEEGVRECIRWSARFSVTLFCMAFVASSLPYFWGNSLSFWMNMNRKYLGVSFGAIHLIHLFFLLLLQYSFHPVFDLAASTSLMAGAGAYFFIILMLLTSFDYFSKFLSPKKWKALHTVGGYWIWAIFMSPYWKAVFRGEQEYIFIAVLLVVVLLLRLGKLKFRLR